MNYPSLGRFEARVIENGLVVLNASLIEETQTPSRTDLEVFKVPTAELAREVGSERAANMVMIGAVCAKTGVLTLDETIHGMEAALAGKEKFFELNQKGIERGFAFVEKGA
jgi:2-oxoglutarate ferredoxin oxidoreductase subunit gamma